MLPYRDFAEALLEHLDELREHDINPLSITDSQRPNSVLPTYSRVVETASRICFGCFPHRQKIQDDRLDGIIRNLHQGDLHNWKRLFYDVTCESQRAVFIELYAEKHYGINPYDLTHPHQPPYPEDYQVLPEFEISEIVDA